MQLFKNLLPFFLFIIFFSYCHNDPNISSNSIPEVNSEVGLPTSLIHTAVSWDSMHASPARIAEFRNYGWEGIGLEAVWDNTDQMLDWPAARNNGYNPIYAELWDGFLRGTSPRLAEAKTLIDSAASQGAHWLCIDDFLTDHVNPFDPQPAIEKTTIDSVCKLAHNVGLKVMVTEDCQTVYLSNSIQANDSLYQLIDIVCPYGYADYSTTPVSGETLMFNHLYNFYDYLQNSLHKYVVPILGYATGIGSDQLGLRSGDVGFIERALQFAYQNKVFYYYDRSSLANLYNLTGYLQQYNYITGTVLAP